jgi:hypothetical protein
LIHHFLFLLSKQDVAWITLPNKQEFILSVYSDGYEAYQPYPLDDTNLGPFAEELIDALGLADSPDYVKIKANAVGEEAKILAGSWTK